MSKADKFKEPVVVEDINYPMYEANHLGIRVRVSKGMYLPGVFSGQLIAEMAYAKYRGKQVEAQAKRKQAKKKEDG